MFEPGKLLAIVGDQHILAGELLGDINQMLKPYEGKAPKDQLDKQRERLMQQMLPGLIRTKMLYQEMLRNVPEENLPIIERKVSEEFDKRQLRRMMKKAEINSTAEMERKLREFGSSIEKQRRSFMEVVMSREIIRQNINSEPEISHDSLLRYYNLNRKDYERPARVRWEELAVRLENHRSKGDAFRAIADMGNRVLRGAALSRVARETSEGYTAKEGGWHDWTIEGSLRAKELEHAVFTLPLNRLSQIIETADGFHVIRVLDREAAGTSPFFKEQVRIKELLRKKEVDAQTEAYVASIQAKTRVWTVFDEPEPEPETAGRTGDRTR